MIPLLIPNMLTFEYIRTQISVGLLYCSAMKGSLMNSGWRSKRSFIGQINDFWTSVTNIFPQNRTFWRQKKLCAVARVTNLFGNENWLGPVMDLFGRLLDLSLENNAFPAALMDLFQKISSRLIKLIVTARPNLSWHYGIWLGGYGLGHVL